MLLIKLCTYVSTTWTSLQNLPSDPHKWAKNQIMELLFSFDKGLHQITSQKIEVTLWKSIATYSSKFFWDDLLHEVLIHCLVCPSFFNTWLFWTSINALTGQCTFVHSPIMYSPSHLYICYYLSLCLCQCLKSLLTKPYSYWDLFSS